MPDYSSYNVSRIFQDRLHGLSVEACNDKTHREFLSALLATLRYELNASYNKGFPLVEEMELLTRVLGSIVRAGNAKEPFDGQYALNTLNQAKESMLGKYAAEQERLLAST